MKLFYKILVVLDVIMIAFMIKFILGRGDVFDMGNRLDIKDTIGIGNTSTGNWMPSELKDNQSELRSERKPNVILISVDALRADHVSSYGYPRNTTPNIDGIAGEGVLFYNAISHIGVTLDSHRSMMTGRYPRMNGVLLSGILQDKGYATGAFVSGFTLSTEVIRNDLYTGFDVYDSNFEREERGSEETSRLALDWIEKNIDKNFFVFIHYFDVHSRYESPYPYNRLFVDDGVIDFPGFVSDTNFSRPYKRMDINYIVSQYDGEIRYVDSVIGKLMDRLDELGLMNNTIIIITSDHGESMGEHNYFFDHGDMIYEGSIKSPLIIRYPPSIPSNRTVDNQVQLVDIMPTILDILSIPLNSRVDGRSLMPLIYGKRGYNIKYTYIIGDWCAPNINPRCTPKTRISGVRTNKWKFIYTPKSYNELYDLENDPNELNNVVDVYSNVSNTMLKLLKTKIDVDYIIFDLPAIRLKLRLTNEKSREKLRALGYID